MRILRNRKGVTLVELLAVVVILGIIAAIAVPTIGGLINRQEKNAAEATFDTIEAAALLYAENATPFTLEDLEDADFIDLKDNKFGWDAGTTVDKDLVWVVVSGNAVLFYEADDVTDGATPELNDPVVADTLYINGHIGNPVE